MRIKFFLVALLILVTSSVYAAPTIMFTSPTLQNNSITGNRSLPFNVTVTEANLQYLSLTFNSVKYQPVDPSLVWWIGMDNRSILGETNSLVRDHSQYNRNLSTITGQANFTYTYASAFGAGWDFKGNGTNTAMEADNTIPIINSTEATICVWTRPDSFIPGAKLVARLSGEGTGRTPQVGTPSINQFGSQFRNASGSAVTLASTANKVAGNLYLVCPAWNGTSGRANLYINGVNESQGTLFGQMGSANNAEAYIGYSADSNNQYFNGTIFEVMVWNRTLTADEILQLYTTRIEKVNQSYYQLFYNRTNVTTGAYLYDAAAINGSGTQTLAGQRGLTITNTEPPQLSGLSILAECYPTARLSLQDTFSDPEGNKLNYTTIRWYNQSQTLQLHESFLFDDMEDNTSDYGAWTKTYQTTAIVVNTTNPQEGSASLMMVADITGSSKNVGMRVRSTSKNMNVQGFNSYTYPLYLQNASKLSKDENGLIDDSSCQVIVSNETDGSPYARFYCGNDVVSGWNNITFMLNESDSNVNNITNWTGHAEWQIRLIFDSAETQTGAVKVDNIRLQNNSPDLSFRSFTVGSFVGVNISVNDNTSSNSSVYNANLSAAGQIPGFAIGNDDDVNLSNATLNFTVRSTGAVGKVLNITTEYSTLSLTKSFNITANTQNFSYAIIDDWQGSKHSQFPYTIDLVCIQSPGDPALNVSAYSVMLQNTTYVPVNLSWMFIPLQDFNGYLSKHVRVEKTWTGSSEGALFNQTVASLMKSQRFVRNSPNDGNIELSLLEHLYAFNTSTDGYANQTLLNALLVPVETDVRDFWDTDFSYVEKPDYYDRPKSLYNLTGASYWLTQANRYANATYLHNPTQAYLAKYDYRFRCSYALGNAYALIDYGTRIGNTTITQRGTDTIAFVESACLNANYMLYETDMINNSEANGTGNFTSLYEQMVVGKSADMADYYVKICDVTGNLTYCATANRTLGYMQNNTYWRDNVNGGLFTGFRTTDNGSYYYKTVRDVADTIDAINDYEQETGDYGYAAFKTELYNEMVLLHDDTYIGYPYRTEPDYSDFDNNGTTVGQDPLTTEAVLAAANGFRAYYNTTRYFWIVNQTKATFNDSNGRSLDSNVTYSYINLTEGNVFAQLQDATHAFGRTQIGISSSTMNTRTIQNNNSGSANASITLTVSVVPSSPRIDYPNGASEYPTYYFDKMSGVLSFSTIVPTGTMNVTIDAAGPFVTLNGPASNSASTGGTVSFSYTPLDNGTIANCSLLYDGGTVYTTSTTIVNNATNSFVVSGIDDHHALGGAPLYWGVTCTDQFGNVGNSTTNSVVTITSVSSGSGGNSGGSTGGSGSVNTTNASLNVTVNVTKHQIDLQPKTADAKGRRNLVLVVLGSTTMLVIGIAALALR